MYKDFKNQASWESKKERVLQCMAEFNQRLPPDAFNSVDKSEKSLLFLSNMGAIKERLEKSRFKERRNHFSKITRLCTKPSEQPP